MFLHGRASIVLALKTVFLLSIICFNYICFAQFGGGNGTEANPWQISRPEHLNQVRNHLDAFFIQTMNISLDMAPWNDGQGWDPIGNAAGTFTGFYDGDGHIIDGLFINRPQTQYIGLFGHTSLGAVIQNLGVTNVNITGQFSVGGLLGRNLSASKVINCFSTGTVTGTGERIGGLVGYNQNRNSNVINSYSRANVNGGTQVGGLVGHNRNAAAITGSYSTGRVAGDQTGGLVGFTQGWGDDPPDNNYWDSETSGQ